MSEDVRGGRHRQRAGRVAQVGVAADPAGRRHHQRQGPWDAEEAPRDGRLRLDLGSVQLPVPRGARLKAEPALRGELRFWRQRLSSLDAEFAEIVRMSRQ